MRFPRSFKFVAKIHFQLPAARLSVSNFSKHGSSHGAIPNADKAIAVDCLDTRSIQQVVNLGDFGRPLSFAQCHEKSLTRARGGHEEGRVPLIRVFLEAPPVTVI